jgi:HSP20 family protein
MANLARWNRPSKLGMRRDIEDLADEFEMPRQFRRDLARLFEEDLSLASLWTEMDRLMEAFTSPRSMRRQISRLFDEPARGQSAWSRSHEGRFVPHIDLTEREREYVLRVDLPGVRAEDIDVRLEEDRYLTVAGERREDDRREQRRYEHTERAHGSFSRSIELPRAIDPAHIETDFRNGVLELRIPKGQLMPTRRIPVGARQGSSTTQAEPRVLSTTEGTSRDESRDARASYGFDGQRA